MMSFSFDFSTESVDSQPSHKTDVTSASEKQAGNGLTNASSREVIVSWDELEDTPVLPSEFRLKDGCSVNYIASTDKDVQCIKSHSVVTNSSTTSTNDLVPQVYEGGFQVWECSFDLANYIATQNLFSEAISVLELGCGAGLPGIYALLKGASVDFQDFNEEVLTMVTLPSITINCRHKSLWPPKCRLFSGDWTSLYDCVQRSSSSPHRYDVILTSETVYSCDSFAKLHEVMDRLLAERGVVYLAGKSCYFGVGGGTQPFAAYARNLGVFDVDIVEQFIDGVHREILKLTRI